MTTPLRIAFGVLIGLAIVALLAIHVLTTQAKAHEAPSGWQYGNECCSNKDCFQVKDDRTITATSEGWHIGETGETLPYNDRKVKQGKDEHFHRCVMPGNKTRCLYVPQQSF